MRSTVNNGTKVLVRYTSICSDQNLFLSIFFFFLWLGIRVRVCFLLYFRLNSMS